MSQWMVLDVLIQEHALQYNHNTPNLTQPNVLLLGTAGTAMFVMCLFCVLCFGCFKVFNKHYQ